MINMKNIILALIVTTISEPVIAGCDWATTTPPEDTKYKYFVAKSYSENGASDAAKKAEQDIDAQIGRIFGTKLDILSEFYSDEIGATGITRSYERAIGVIRLKGLERQKGDVEKTSHGWTGCVQYRYLKSEIKQEQARLSKLSDKELQKSLVFTEVSGDTSCKGAPVEIITEPNGAYVTIDDGKYQGAAPIKFGNVCNGKHTLDITHNDYQALSEKLIVPTSGHIKRTLKRDTKKITIKTPLGNSDIEINGIKHGREPVVLNAPLGVEHTITATNAESITITRTRRFSKESEDVYIIPMEKLPGKIDFTAFKKRNPDVSVFVDGGLVDNNITTELNSDKAHKVKFSKEGYFDITKNIDVMGGETTYYPSGVLEFSKESTRNLGLYIGTGINMSTEHKFGGNFDLGIDLKYDFLYANTGLHLSYLSTPCVDMHFDFSDYPNTYPYRTHTAKIQTYYLDFLRADIGLNITNRISIFGSSSLGMFNLSRNEAKVSASYITVADKSKIIFRYGFGLQYARTIKENAAEWGIRLGYLTGKIHLSSSDVSLDTSYWRSADVKNKFLDNTPKDITNFNITFFIRGLSLVK